MSNQTEKRITALYCRLSQEDEKKGDSDSIEMLQRYAKQNGFTNTQVFVDDGYSGVSFNRPGFHSLLERMENGKVETLITKDLSRLGRNYIEVGQYSRNTNRKSGLKQKGRTAETVRPNLSHRLTLKNPYEKQRKASFFI